MALNERISTQERERKGDISEITEIQWKSKVIYALEDIQEKEGTIDISEEGINKELDEISSAEDISNLIKKIDKISYIIDKKINNLPRKKRDTEHEQPRGKQNFVILKRVLYFDGKSNLDYMDERNKGNKDVEICYYFSLQ